jgi:hypothetical protein
VRSAERRGTAQERRLAECASEVPGGMPSGRLLRGRPPGRAVPTPAGNEVAGEASGQTWAEDLPVKDQLRKVALGLSIRLPRRPAEGEDKHREKPRDSHRKCHDHPQGHVDDATRRALCCLPVRHAKFAVCDGGCRAAAQL